MTSTHTAPIHSPDAPGDSPADLDGSPDAAGEYSPPPVAQLVAIAVDDLVADRRNQRRPLDAELVASVAAHGVLEPILATPDAERPGSFRIVAGERRWRAARKAGLATVPAIVRTLSEAEAAEIQLVENLARSDLSATQAAAAMARCIEVTPADGE